jgi:hypothetical protein
MKTAVFERRKNGVHFNKPVVQKYVVCHLPNYMVAEGTVSDLEKAIKPKIGRLIHLHRLRHVDELSNAVSLSLPVCLYIYIDVVSPIFIIYI